MAKNRDLSKLANRLTVDNNYNVGISGSLSVTGSIISTVSTLWSGSAQLPSGVVSSSAQTIANLPSGTVSGSAQVLNGTTIHSGTFFNGVTVVSGSGQISYTGITNVPSGIISGSSQLPSGVVSGSAQTIANLPSGTVSGSAQVDVMSTTNIARLATTGSNTFQGNQTINGSLVVTGSLTAQQFIVSSSVTYLTESFASGSHKFGDSSDDTHQFTGSVYVSGSLTTTGVATFSSTVQATQYTATSTGGSGLRVYGASGTNQWDVYLNSTNLRFSDNTGTGSIVFDRPLNGTSATFSGDLTLQGSVTRNIKFLDSSNTNLNAQIQYDQISATSGQLFFGTNNAGTFATRLTIASTGAATFSSSVTATSGNFTVDGVATNSVLDILTLSHTTSGTAASGLGAGILFKSERPSGGVNLSRAAIYGIAGSNPDDDGDLTFYTRTDTSGAGFTEKMRITSDGNVGIGTTAPISTLLNSALTIYKVYNSDSSSIPSPNAQLYGNNQSGLYLFGRNSGLTIVGANSEQNQIIFANSSTVAYASINTNTGTSSTGGDMYFNVGSNTERIRIYAADGNVFIGSSPSNGGYKLDVNGTIRSFSANPLVVAMASNSANNATISARWTSGSGMDMIYHPDSAVGFLQNTYPVEVNQLYGDIQFRNSVDGTMTPRMIIKGHSGNVGVGTNSPASQATGAITGILDVSAATGGNLVLHRTSGGDTALFSILKASNGTYIDSTGAATAANNSIYFRNNDINGDQTSLTTRLTILSGGNVGIGTTTPNQLVSIRKTSAGAETIALALQNIGSTAGTAVSMIFCPHESSATPEPLAKISGIRTAHSGAPTDLVFYTYGVGGLIEKMRLTSSGQINVNHSTTNYDVAYFTNGSASPYGMNITFTGAAPNNTTNNFIYLADTSGIKCRIVSNGSIYNSTGTYGSISDIKLKENIVDTTPKLENLLKVKVRNYNLIGDKLKQIGVVAQELETIFPSLVEDTFDKETNETTKSVKYSVFVPILIKAIQELSAKVSLLENK